MNAAKNFIVLKQDARVLHETFEKSMTDNQLELAVKDLHNRYKEIVKLVPPTDKKSFEEAKKRVQEGIHEQD